MKKLFIVAVTLFAASLAFAQDFPTAKEWNRGVVGWNL